MVLYSHDSMTYLTPTNIFSWIGIPWARTQNKTVKEQYELGVRWFDIRINFDKKGEPYFCHGGMKLKCPKGETVKSILTEMSTWKDIYLWIKLEERFDDGNNTNEVLFNSFKDWCNSTISKNCAVLCDLRVYDWLPITDDVSEIPAVIPKLRGGGFMCDISSTNSIFPQFKLLYWWIQPTGLLGPWLFSKLFNNKILNKARSENVDILHIDYINKSMYDKIKDLL